MLSSEYRGKGWWEQYANKALEVNKLQRHHCQANSSHWCSFSCNKEVTSSHQASCLHEPPHAWPAVSPSSRLWEVQRRWRVYIRRTAEEPCLQGALQQRSSSLPLLWGIKPQNVKSSARTEGRPDHRVQPRRGTANPGAGTVSPLPSPSGKRPPESQPSPSPARRDAADPTQQEPSQAAAPRGRAAGLLPALLPALLREGHGRHRRRPPAGPGRTGLWGERSAAPGRAAQSPARSPGSPLALQPFRVLTRRNRSPRPSTAAPLRAGASRPSPAQPAAAAPRGEPYPRGGRGRTQAPGTRWPTPSPHPLSRVREAGRVNRGHTLT